MNRRETLALMSATMLGGLSSTATAGLPGDTMGTLLQNLKAVSNAPGVGIGLWDPAWEAPQIGVLGARYATDEEDPAAPAVETDDLWHIGSNTKSMTAFMIARLVEAGALNWDSEIGEVLDVRVPRMRDDYRTRTIQDLLTHRAGLHPNPSVIRTFRFVMDDNPMLEQHVKLAQNMLGKRPITRSGPPFPFSYSNAGYVVAAAMAEAATGRDWQDLMRSEVFEPLGLTSAGFGPPPEGNPQGHKMSSGRTAALVPKGHDELADNPEVIWPAGGVHLSLGDHIKYMRAFMDKPNVLRRATWQQLTAPVDDYACGWAVQDGRIWAHDGSNTLWFSHCMFCPSTGRALIANMNYLPSDRASGVLSIADGWVAGTTEL